MKSPVVKRSIVVAGHKTSVSLEEAFWNGMKEISSARGMTLSELVGEIGGQRKQGNLSSRSSPIAGARRSSRTFGILFARDEPITLTISGLAVCESNRTALPADACACVSEGVQMMISQRDVRATVPDPVKV